MKHLLLAYNQPTPRYTSYPPANLFLTNVGNEQYREHVERSNHEGEHNISFYIHMPFCKQKCHFCGCNSLAWTSDSIIERYFAALIMEIEEVCSRLDTSGRRVSQVHWGGGTPNNLPLHLLEQVMTVIDRMVSFSPNAEIAIECNPAYLDLAYLDGLASMGFNRISLGIQDFDASVLAAINRSPSLVPIDQLILEIRKRHIGGINLDFVYGLPFQNEEIFARTIQAALSLAPDRIVTFSYAHLPSVIPGQRLIDPGSLPSDDQKLDMFLTARNILTNAGYTAIGFDHYALPSDDLAVASREKTLKRNFQGYCTSSSTGQVYAFGASGISQLYGAYFQNEKSVDAYISRIEEARLAVARGYILSRHEMICQHVIEEILCNGLVDFLSISRHWRITPDELFEVCQFRADEVQPYIADNLAVMTPQKLELSPAGMLVARNIAQLFDPTRTTRGMKHSSTI